MKIMFRDDRICRSYTYLEKKVRTKRSVVLCNGWCGMCASKQTARLYLKGTISLSIHVPSLPFR